MISINEEEYDNFNSSKSFTSDEEENEFGDSISFKSDEFFDARCKKLFKFFS
jgi:hypothetical protein